MTVGDLMTKTVRCCGPQDSLDTAAHQLWDGDCGALPVVDGPERRVVGMLTDRDICMAAHFRGRPLGQITVERVMSSKVQSCHTGDEVSSAEATMKSAQVRRLPVVDDAGQLLGMISLADIAREAAQIGSGRRPACSESEVVGTLSAIVGPHRESLATAG
jgi:CBS-domain-containing membrane protein